MYNKKKIKVSDSNGGERSMSMDLSGNVDASAYTLPVVPAGLDDKIDDDSSASPDSAAYIMDTIAANEPVSSEELDAICDKSWLTRTDAKFELETKYKEHNNKPIGEDIKYRGGKQLRLICNGCDSFCVTVRMKRLRVAGEESVSKFFVIKDKSCLDHVNCDPSKIKYDVLSSNNEEGGQLAQTPKRRISTSTHRSSYLGTKREEATAQEGAAGERPVLAHFHSANGTVKKILLQQSSNAALRASSPGASSDSSEECELISGHALIPSSGAAKKEASRGKYTSKATSTSSEALLLSDLQGGDLDPNSMPNKFWGSRSEAKAELEQIYGVQSAKCLGEDTKYRGGKQLKLICHGCKNFCITARMKRLRIPNSRDKVSRFFVIKTKTKLDHFTMIDDVKIPCDGSLIANGRSLRGLGAAAAASNVLPEGLNLDNQSVDSEDM